MDFRLFYFDVVYESLFFRKIVCLMDGIVSSLYWFN